MKHKDRKILYTHIGMRSFVVRDIEHLGKENQVVPYFFSVSPKYQIPFSFIKQSLHLIFFGRRYDVYLMFFGGYHSLLPAFFARLYGKTSILFLGGTDCFKYPSFGYGNYTRKWYGWCTCQSARLASLLAPVSANLIRGESTYYTVDSTRQGIYEWCKALKTPFQVVPLEYNPDFFFRRNITRIKDSFITVAFGIQGAAFIRKGIDKFIAMAKAFPESPFTIIGCHPDEFPVPLPPNVTALPPVPYEALPEHYSRHTFYVQLSIAEGFPSAICEAMLCECIPIGSKVAALPDIIGQTGFFVHHRDDEEIFQTFKLALQTPDLPGLGQQARHHIISHFGPGSRRDVLKELVQGIPQRTG